MRSILPMLSKAIDTNLNYLRSYKKDEHKARMILMERDDSRIEQLQITAFEMIDDCLETHRILMTAYKEEILNRIDR